jgi:hypothetical protein
MARLDSAAPAMDDPAFGSHRFTLRDSENERGFNSALYMKMVNEKRQETIENSLLPLYAHLAGGDGLALIPRQRVLLPAHIVPAPGRLHSRWAIRRVDSPSQGR